MSLFTGCANSWNVPGGVTASVLSLPNAPNFTGNLNSLTNDAGFLTANAAGNVYTGNGQTVSFGNVVAVQGNIATVITSRVQLPNAPAFTGNLSSLVNDTGFVLSNAAGNVFSGNGQAVSFGNVATGGLAVTGTQSVSGLTTATGGITVPSTAAATFQGNQTVGGTLSVTGLTTATGGIQVPSTATANFAGSATVGTNHTVGGTQTVTGKVNANGGLGVTGNETVSGTLSVTGVTTLTKRLDWTAITSFGGNVVPGTGANLPQYCVDELGYIRLRGQVTTNIASPGGFPMVYLPVNGRPTRANTLSMNAFTSASSVFAAYVSFTTDGNVVGFANWPSGATMILDGLCIQ